jgi:LPS-assembly lipoprotein
MSAALLLQGCGFHLKGKVELSPTLQNVYVEGRDPAMVADLRRSLEFSGAQVASSAEAASSALLVDSRYQREVRTLDSRGLATGYTLRYEARFAVVTPSGEEIFRSSLISVRRNFDFDADQVLQKETEEEFLQDDMREKIVQRIMRQLSTI